MSICMDCKQPIPCLCDEGASQFGSGGSLRVPVGLQFEPSALRGTGVTLAGSASLPLEVTDSVIEQTKTIMATSPIRAAGYRIKVLLLESSKGLSAGEAEIAPTLAKLGFNAKSDNQKAREDKGTDNALIVDIGPAAFNDKQRMGDKPWASVGNVIKIIRYTGHAYEEPPGSGKRYALLNDEDILGYYQQGVSV